jgi:hypothetical protein
MSVLRKMKECANDWKEREARAGLKRKERRRVRDGGWNSHAQLVGCARREGYTVSMNAMIVLNRRALA